MSLAKCIVMGFLTAEPKSFILSKSKIDPNVGLLGTPHFTEIISEEERDLKRKLFFK